MFVQSTVQPSGRRENRLHAVDSAKGIGIALVVFGHAWRGAFAADILPDTQLFTMVDSAIYAFHMPLFFLLSGLIFVDAAMRRPIPVLLRTRAEKLLWPMALWTWIFFGLRAAVADGANAPVTIADFPWLPFPPYEHFWFLWALFVIQIVGLALVRVLSGAGIPTEKGFLAIGALGIAMALANPFFAVPSILWGPIVEHAPYFLFGIALGARPQRRPASGEAALAMLLIITVYVAWFDQRMPVVGSLILIWAFWRLWCGVESGQAALAPLRALGHLSLVIYLTHTIFSAAARIAMQATGLDQPSLVIVVTTAVGLLLPVAVFAFVERFGLRRAFGF